MIYKLVFIFFFLNFNTFAHDYPQYQAIDGYNCDRASDINLTNQCRQSRKWTKPYNGILYDGHIHPQHTKNIDKYTEELRDNKYELIVVMDTPNGYKKYLKGKKKFKKNLKKSQHFLIQRFCVEVMSRDLFKRVNLNLLKII